MGPCPGRQSSVSRWWLRQLSIEGLKFATGHPGGQALQVSTVIWDECWFIFFSSTGRRAELALLSLPSTQRHHGLSGATQPAMANSPLMHSPTGMDMSRAALGHMLFPRSTPCLQGVRPPGLSLFSWPGEGPRNPGLSGLCRWVGWKGKASMGIAGGWQRMRPYQRRTDQESKMLTAGERSQGDVTDAPRRC